MGRLLMRVCGTCHAKSLTKLSYALFNNQRTALLAALLAASGAEPPSPVAPAVALVPAPVGNAEGSAVATGAAPLHRAEAFRAKTGRLKGL